MLWHLEGLPSAEVKGGQCQLRQCRAGGRATTLRPEAGWREELPYGGQGQRLGKEQPLVPGSSGQGHRGSQRTIHVQFRRGSGEEIPIVS